MSCLLDLFHICQKPRLQLGQTLQVTWHKVVCRHFFLSALSLKWSYYFLLKLMKTFILDFTVYIIKRHQIVSHLWVHIPILHKLVTNHCGCNRLLLDPVSFIDFSSNFLTFSQHAHLWEKMHLLWKAGHNWQKAFCKERFWSQIGAYSYTSTNLLCCQKWADEIPLR